MWTEERPFRSCHRLRVAVTCLPQIRPSPKHALSARLTAFHLSDCPSLPLYSRWSPFTPCASLLCRSPPSCACFSTLLSSHVAHASLSGIDRCHRRTNIHMHTHTHPDELVSDVACNRNQYLNPTVSEYVRNICGGLCNIKYNGCSYTPGNS